MQRNLRFLRFPLAALFALSVVCAAHAQDIPRVDLFGGYTYLRANVVVSGSSASLNEGSGSLAYNFNKWLGAVGDLGVYHQGNVAGSGASLTVSSYQVGPRLSWRKSEHLVPFAQLLLGAGHAGGTIYTNSLGAGLAPLGSNNAFLLTTGGGVDWKLNHNFGIRLFQAEYLYSQFLNGNGDNNRQNSFRLSFGVVYSFGNR